MADARRHCVGVRGPDITISLTYPTPQPDLDSTGSQAIRIGLAEVRGIGDKLTEQIVHDHRGHGHFQDLPDLGDPRLTTPQMEAPAHSPASVSRAPRHCGQGGAGAGERLDRPPGTGSRPSGFGPAVESNVPARDLPPAHRGPAAARGQYGIGSRGARRPPRAPLRTATEQIWGPRWPPRPRPPERRSRGHATKGCLFRLHCASATSTVGRQGRSRPQRGDA